MAHPEEKTVAIPESIVLNGVTYSVKETPELLGLMQAVAKQEKTKLYGQFESLKNQVQLLSNVKIEPSQTPLGATQYDQLKAAIVQELLPELKDAVREVVQPVLDSTAQSAQETLDQYRTALLAENNATCIPELVKGNTKEELRASLAESIRLRAAYPPHQSTERVTDPLLASQAAALESPVEVVAPVARVVAPTIPQVPSIPSPEVARPDSPKTMSMTEFSQQRDSILQTLEAEYGGGQ